MIKKTWWLVLLLTVSLLAEGKPTLKSGIDLNNFDKSFRPQDNFYYFVNGTWLRNTVIPADRSNYGSFTVLAEKAEKDIKNIIMEVAAKPNVAGSPEQKIADLYASYMDSLRIEKLGIRPLMLFFNKINRIKNRKQLARVFASMRSVGVQTPFALYVAQDKKNATHYITYESQSGLGLPDRDYYFRKGEKFENIRKSYLHYIEKLLSLAGQENAAAKARAIFDLEKKLAGYHWTRVQNRDANKTYNLIKVKELKKLSPDFPWRDHLKQAGLTDIQQLVVRQPDYLKGFNDVFKTTNIDTWKAYLTYKTINEFSRLLSGDFVHTSFDFYGKTLRGIEKNRPRWKRAISAVNSILGQEVGKIYVKRHFSPAAKKRMKMMVENLRLAFADRIRMLDWMSKETKDAALKKLDLFTVKVGYPDKWKDYSGLEISKTDLFGNYIRAARFQYKDNISRLGKPVDRTEWFMTPQTVNAYYNPTLNEIVFPAAILQPPFFFMDADDAVNYGAIGAVIGHEMTHGFDDQGSRYDGLGNLNNWWTDQDNREFKKRAEKLANQYNQYIPLDTIHLNGHLTLGENIADLGGLTIAYLAYQNSLRKQKAPVIDGFSGSQRFFIGWAQVWRRKYKKAELMQRLLTDPHSPSEYRVLGVVSNIPEFYEAFHVKETDKMYFPEEKRVKIW